MNQTTEVRELGNKEKVHVIKIQIDRVHYDVEDSEMTGAQIRLVAKPPIGADRDLFEVVPGASDLKIGDSMLVQLHNGMRFFTAPGQINPGSNK